MAPPPPPSIFATDFADLAAPAQFEQFGEDITYEIPGDADRSLRAVFDSTTRTIRRSEGHARDQVRETKIVIGIDEDDAGDGLPTAKLSNVTGHKLTHGSDVYNVLGIAERGAATITLRTQIITDIARRASRTEMNR